MRRLFVLLAVVVPAIVWGLSIVWPGALWLVAVIVPLSVLLAVR